MPHPWEVRLQHDRLGRETLRTMTGGVAYAMQYDGVGRPSRQSVTRGGHSLYNRSYRWDDDFRLSHAHDAISGRIVRYFYDDFGSLAEAEYGDGARQWRSPDVMGNVYDSADRTDRTYARGGQLREDRRWRYHYDKQGNLVLKTKRKIPPIAETPQGDRKSVFGLFASGGTSKEKGREDGALTWHPGDYAYTWLPNGMLGSVTRPDGKVVTFKYDALGRRIEKTINGRVHRYLWDGDVVLHEWEYDETERPQQIVAENGEVSFDRPEPTDNLVTWVYDPDSYVPTAKLVNGKRYGIVSDYIGRPVQAYDEHGTPVWQADYDIYGNLLNLKGDRKFVPFRQLGQYEDEETGLYYNRFRYYDSNTGGYISQDPIGLAGNNPTLYAFVKDVNIEVDVFGLDCKMNKARGDAGRDALINRLQESKRFDVLGTEVRINTPNSPHYRVADIVVLDKKTNKIHIIEVKTGGATRDASQLAKDMEISKGNGTTWGSRKADKFGITGVSKGNATGSIQTIEVKVDPETGKILR